MTTRRLLPALTLAVGLTACGEFQPQLGPNPPPAPPVPVATTPDGDGSFHTVIDATSDSAYTGLDLEGGGVRADYGPSLTGWDLAFERYRILTDSGIHGGGACGTVAYTTGASTFAALTAAPDPASTTYAVDATQPCNNPGGRCSLYVGSPFDVWWSEDAGAVTPGPYFFVLRSRSGLHYFKIQVVGYYDSVGDPAFVTIHWAPVAPPPG